MQFRPFVDYDRVLRRLDENDIAFSQTFYPMREIVRRVGKAIKRTSKPVVPGLFFFKSKAADLPASSTGSATSHGATATHAAPAPPTPSSRAARSRPTREPWGSLSIASPTIPTVSCISSKATKWKSPAASTKAEPPYSKKRSAIPTRPTAVPPPRLPPPPHRHRTIHLDRRPRPPPAHPPLILGHIPQPSADFASKIISIIP